MAGEYVLLGRSGLRVSRLCLGTMTFGMDWGWGSAEEASRQIFNRFLDSGGNFIDTADGYTNGTSETLLGKFLKERGARDRTVVATKFGFGREPGNPNAGGLGRKNIYSALETSLRRLQTDYIDLYWLHNWDTFTPAEELMATLDDLVRAGKVRYLGFSNCPGWFLGRAQTIAELRGLTPIIALQLEYSLVEREIEKEHLPAALELGMGITPWSPLAGGLLTGKYQSAKGELTGDGRLHAVKEHPSFRELFNERNWKIASELVKVAGEIGRTPAQVALNWVANRAGVSSTTIGATKLDQLEDNLRSLDFAIPPELGRRLEEISAPPITYPYYFFFKQEFRDMVSGSTSVRRTRPREAA
ncbi:MAG: aldo/keto reductase [Acidobacteria bacterium]|nr:aldo/keto reductase [Acidobacteriota bacterium]